MRLVHFAYILTALLLAATSYLAWEGQQAARGAKEELDFVKKKQAAADSAAPAPESLVAVPMPATSSITPPSPGTLAIAPAAPSAPSLSAPTATELPGGGLTVPKTVVDAEAKGVNTNTLTPAQKQVREAKPIGKVKTIVKDQGFIVLDVGSKQGLAKGQQLEVRRDNSVLGRLRVSDTIEENEAVADLDLSSVPAGVSIEPGDEVIQPTAR
ncbi:hypothetical protein [Brevifollis gellanilyticus]|uniref:SAF domain-containing protein n=1 Tax=Brevifollis gellanilyticus TaxID=748831 RepID=A0A512M3H6_9BACT|nr:hypothetical protein [Brevifollis gellanilyticus]GEP41290.1 hypothetical protein BGE01nite_05810 [Brevifollis gellanilyticus]